MKLLVWASLVIGLKVMAIFIFGIGFERKQKNAFGRSIAGTCRGALVIIVGAIWSCKLQGYARLII